MLHNFRRSGAPWGPLGEPRNTYMAASGRGKVHLTAHCRAGLQYKAQRLRDLKDADLCSKCTERVRNLSDEESAWLEQGKMLGRWMRSAQHHLDKLGTTAQASDPTSTWATTRLRLLILQDPDLLMGAWAQEHVTPVLRELANDARAVPTWAHRDDWSARHLVTVHSVGDGYTLSSSLAADSRTYPAILGRKTLGSPPAGTHDILRTVRSAICVAYRNGTDTAGMIREGLRAGEVALATHDTFLDYTQIPTDAPVPEGEHATFADLADVVWRTAVRAEIITWTTAVTDAIVTQEAAEQENPLPMRALLLRMRGYSDNHLADAAVTDHVVAHLGNRQVIAWLPGPLSREVLAKGCAFELHTDFGEVQPGDTPQTFVTAHQLADKDALSGSTGRERADLARLVTT